jgi:hypothetical protein
MWRAVAIILLLLTPAAQAQNKATLDSVSVHLFLEKSGTLSPDVTAIPNFRTWNFAPATEGIPQDELFHAILVKLRITAPGEHFASGKVAELTLTNRTTKKVAKRARIADVYVGPEGAVFVPVLVEDAACGPFTLVVTGGAKRIAKSLELNCGE